MLLVGYIAAETGVNGGYADQADIQLCALQTQHEFAQSALIAHSRLATGIPERLNLFKVLIFFRIYPSLL